MIIGGEFGMFVFHAIWLYGTVGCSACLRRSNVFVLWKTLPNATDCFRGILFIKIGQEKSRM